MGEFFPKLWENTKFFPNFSDKFVPKIGESPNLSSNFGTNSPPNLVNPQICPQISGQIRPQICPQKAREHTSFPPLLHTEKGSGALVSLKQAPVRALAQNITMT